MYVLQWPKLPGIHRVLQPGAAEGGVGCPHSPWLLNFNHKPGWSSCGSHRVWSQWSAFSTQLQCRNNSGLFVTVSPKLPRQLRAEAGSASEVGREFSSVGSQVCEGKRRLAKHCLWLERERGLKTFMSVLPNRNRMFCSYTFTSAFPLNLGESFLRCGWGAGGICPIQEVVDHFFHSMCTY